MSASRCSMVSFWQVKQPHVQPLFSESKAQIVFHTPKLYSQTHTQAASPFTSLSC